MHFEDQVRILAPRAAVYAALNEPGILARCLPGCQDLTREADGALAAVVKLKIGPVSATFKGRVVLDTANAPERFSLAGEGAGGIAGMAKGRADVALDDLGAETVLHYVATTEIAGKIAQLGSRLITSTANRLALQFFTAFKAEVDRDVATA